MKKLILLSALLILNCLNLKSQNFAWGYKTGGANQDESKSVATDAAGNIFVCGIFEGTVDFDPGPAVSNMTSAGDIDLFITKTDLAGNLIWATQIGGTEDEYCFDMVLDPFGNVLITGYFEGTTDFNPGAGVANLVSSGLRDVFVCKLNTSGNYVWAKKIGGTGYDSGLSICSDALGNVYTSGAFASLVDFNPGAGVHNMTALGNYDAFVCKLTSAGNYVWAKQLGGNGDDNAYGICVDINGNVYTTGYFKQTADMNPGAGIFNLVSAGFEDLFISKLDASGNFLWAVGLGSAGLDIGLDLAVDASSNIIITGYFENSIDFNPGIGNYSLYSNGDSDGFILKLDEFGNFLWANSMGGLGSDQYSDLVVDAADNIYISGAFEGNVDFDPGAGIQSFNALGGRDGFIQKLNTSGDLLWAGHTGGTGGENITSVAVNLSGDLLLTGYLTVDIDLDPTAGILNATCTGLYDYFVSKLTQNTPLPTQLLSFEGRTEAYKNILNWTTSKEINNASFNLERSADGKLFQSIGQIAGAGTAETKTAYTYSDDHPYPQGYYRLKQTDFDGNFTYSNIVQLIRSQISNSLTLWPNPANNVLNLSWQLSEKSMVDIHIYSLTGQLVKQLHEESTVGNQHLEINLTKLNPGNYLLKWSAGNQMQEIRFSKQ